VAEAARIAGALADAERPRPGRPRLEDDPEGAWRADVRACIKVRSKYTSYEAVAWAKSIPFGTLKKWLRAHRNLERRKQSARKSGLL
jgi:hypothetical protein